MNPGPGEPRGWRRSLKGMLIIDVPNSHGLIAEKEGPPPSTASTGILPGFRNMHAGCDPHACTKCILDMVGIQ